ncbi:MAG: hypothetical protein D4R67_01025 [Bacteroidetes bacterium]|nr:MAG: hypothetical protein D4R67_01025 [Bacteroidota bacterium]
MPDPKKHTHNPRFYRHFIRALIWIFGIVCLVSLASYITMDYFGEHIMKRYLQRKIREVSQGVYEIDFDRFRLNIFSGKAMVTGFHLIPNETRYHELREKGEVKGPLYSLDYERLTLNNLDIGEIFFNRTIHLRMIELDKPTISFIAFPDSVAKKRGRFKQIYQDIYPVLSVLFSEVKIDSILVREGSFSGKHTNKTGNSSEMDWLYSATLRDFDLNSHDNKDTRIFYSRDVELRIRNFNYSLSDSLYFLNADEVGLSLSNSRLFGKGLTLTPNFRKEKLARTKSGSFYQAYLPDFSIDGIDLYKALLEKEISISAIIINNLEVKMFLHRANRTTTRNENNKITTATLYTIIQDKLKQVTIDTILLTRASFQFYSGIQEPKPELKVDRTTLRLYGFQLDSLAHLDTTKIIYSKDIEIDIEGFTLALQDKLHDLRARKVFISTRNSLIDVRDTRLYPSPDADPSLRYKSNAYYQMQFPQVLFERINLRHMFNTRKLEFDRLAIFEPDMTIIQYRKKAVPEDSSTRHETFLEKLDLIRSVIIPYMISVEAGTIEISNARISFKDDKKGMNEERIAGLVDLTLTGLRVDTLTYRDRKEFLSQIDLLVEVRDFHYLSPDSLHRVNFRELFANSVAQDLDITGFTMHTTSKRHAGTDTPSTLTARFNSLQVTGFDYPKWMSDKWFNANEIRLSEPSVVIRSVRKKRESSLNEPFSETDEAVKKIEVGTIRIDHGWFDLMEENQKSRGSLLVRNFDFQLTNFLFDLTGWDDGVKILRYDLLSLKPDPANPILLDSSYSISFSRFLSDSYPPNLTVSQLHLAPMNPGDKTSLKPLLVELSLPSFLIKKLELEQLVFNRNLKAEEIRITEPEITLFHQVDIKEQKRIKKQSLSSHPELATPFHTLDIGNVSLTDGIFHYLNGQGDSATGMSLDRIYATIRGFSYDSAHNLKTHASLFYCDDIDLHTGGYSFLTKDSMNTVSMAGLHLSSGRATLTIDSFALVPNYSDYEYSRKLGYQTDRMELTTKEIELERVNFISLVEEQKIEAGIMNIDGLVLDDYRDKRIEFPYWKRPPMIQQAIREIPLSITVDSIKLVDGKVTYREQTGEEPGMIFFDRMDLLVRNFTSDSIRISRGAVLVADGSTWLMGQAKAHGEFMFPMNSPVDTFFFCGGAGRVDMTIFNPMVSRVAPVRIKSGVVDSLTVRWLRGNGTYATGLLDLYYHNLHVELLKEKPGFWNRAGTDLMQLVLNLVVPQENPGYFGIHRSGYIWNRRDDEKGYFNFYWKSLLSGLKSSEGLNSKEQRAFKKTLNREKKSKKH